MVRVPHPACWFCVTSTTHAFGPTGGQIIRRMARKAMSLPEGSGTAVFEYKAAPSELQKGITAAVNRAAHQLSEQQREGVLKEHCLVFEFNNSIISGFQVRGDRRAEALARHDVVNRHSSTKWLHARVKGQVRSACSDNLGE